MSKSTYRLIDLLILTIISAVIEIVNIFAFRYFPYEGFSASFIIVIGLIAMYRWGAYGIIVPVISGFASVFTTGVFNDINYVLSSTIGYAGMAVALLCFHKQDKKEMSSNIGKLIVYFFVGFIFAEAGRALCYIGSVNVGDAMFTIFVLDLFNLVLNLVVFIIATKRKNFVYDMNQYLVEINEKSKIPSSATMREAQQDYLALESIAESNQVSECALLDGGMLTDEDLIQLQRTYNEHTGQVSKFDNKNKMIKEETNAKS